MSLLAVKLGMDVLQQWEAVYIACVLLYLVVAGCASNIFSSKSAEGTSDLYSCTVEPPSVIPDAGPVCYTVTVRDGLSERTHTVERRYAAFDGVRNDLFWRRIAISDPLDDLFGIALRVAMGDPLFPPKQPRPGRDAQMIAIRAARLEIWANATLHDAGALAVPKVLALFQLKPPRNASAALFAEVESALEALEHHRPPFESALAALEAASRGHMSRKTRPTARLLTRRTTRKRSRLAAAAGYVILLIAAALAVSLAGPDGLAMPTTLGAGLRLELPNVWPVAAGAAVPTPPQPPKGLQAVAAQPAAKAALATAGAAAASLLLKAPLIAEAAVVAAPRVSVLRRLRRVATLATAGKAAQVGVVKAWAKAAASMAGPEVTVAATSAAGGLRRVKAVGAGTLAVILVGLA